VNDYTLYAGKPLLRTGKAGEADMNKTLIEWVKNPDGTQGYTWNPITGCNNQIDGMCQGGNFPCYAYRLANGRLKQRYLANKNTVTQNYDEDSYPFYPRWWPERLEQIPKCRMFRGLPFEPDRRGIFVCDMSDLFGIGIPEQWTRCVLSYIKSSPQHRFYTLTKQPQNLIKWSPFPDNCWVGFTATNNTALQYGLAHIADVEAKIKYISFEPLLEKVNLLAVEMVDWVIIGALTGREAELGGMLARYPRLELMPYGRIWTLQPRIEWVKEIIEACDKAKIPVFLKNNLQPLFPTLDIRQEMPA